MLVQYGNQNFELENIRRWDMRPIYSEDGVDFLYYHLTLGLVMVWNPAATTSKPDSPPTGNLGPVSVARLKQAMLTPRQILRITFGDITILESPGICGWNKKRFSLDCKNGPQPISFNVIRIDGAKTVVCYFEIETYLNDMGDASSLPPILLSHRWEETHQLDELFYTTRIIQGRAVFRNDMLVTRGQYFLPPLSAGEKSSANPLPGTAWWTTWKKTPDTITPAQATAGISVERLYADDYRSRLIHQPPEDFKLVHLSCKLSSDGSTLDYTIVQRQQPINLIPNGGIVKFSGQWIYSYPRSSFMDIGGVELGLNLQFWGNRQTTRQTLLNAATKALTFYGFDARIGEFHVSYRTSVIMDLFDRHLQVSVAYTAGGAVSVLQLIAGQKETFDRAGKFLSSFPEADEVVTTTGQTVTIANGVTGVTTKMTNPYPAIDQGARSSHCRMRSQVPSTPNLIPRRPINDPNYTMVFDFNDT